MNPGKHFIKRFEKILKLSGSNLNIYKNWNTQEMISIESNAIKTDEKMFEFPLNTNIERGDVIQFENSKSFWKVSDVDEERQFGTPINLNVKVVKVDYLGNELSINSEGKAIFNAPVYGGVQVGGQNNTQNNALQLPKVSLKAEITFNRTHVFGSSDEHYGWQIKLINDGESTVYNFRVDIKFPNILLNQSTLYMIEVVEKRTEDYRLFRATSERHNNKVLHAEDEYPIFSGNYSISKEMRENGDLERLVVISIFADDKLVNKIERKMSEFVNNE